MSRWDNLTGCKSFNPMLLSTELKSHTAVVYNSVILTVLGDLLKSNRSLMTGAINGTPYIYILLVLNHVEILQQSQHFQLLSYCQMPFYPGKLHYPYNQFTLSGRQLQHTFPSTKNSFSAIQNTNN